VLGLAIGNVAPTIAADAENGMHDMADKAFDHASREKNSLTGSRERHPAAAELAMGDFHFRRHFR